MMVLIMRSEKKRRVKDNFKISGPQRNRVDIYGYWGNLRGEEQGVGRRNEDFGFVNVQCEMP